MLAVRTFSGSSQQSCACPLVTVGRLEEAAHEYLLPFGDEIEWPVELLLRCVDNEVGQVSCVNTTGPGLSDQAPRSARPYPSFEATMVDAISLRTDLGSHLA